MRVVRGDLADLDHGVAITSGFSFDSGVHLGDRLAGSSGGCCRARRARPLLGRDRAAVTVPAKYATPCRSCTSSTPARPTSTSSSRARTPGCSPPTAGSTRWTSRPGPATTSACGCCSARRGCTPRIAIVNSVLVGASQRRAQLRTVALLGATREQLRRMALWEAGLVGAAALLVGGAVTAPGGLDDPHLDLGQRGGAAVHAAVAAARGDRRHLCRADAGRSVGRVAARGQASARVSARTVSGSSSLSP